MRVRLRWNRKYFPILLLLLAGCFRQAGQSFEPVEQATQPPQIATQGPQTTSPATPTLPPITLLPSPTDLATDIPTATSVPASATPRPAQPTSQPLAATSAASPTSTFITPGGPSAPITPDTATPTPGQSSTPTPSGLITPTALVGSADEDGCTYTVQPGNNLFRIAINNNITLAELQAANPGVGEIIQIGQVLNIPGCGEGLGGDDAPEEAVEPGTTLATPVITGEIAGVTTYIVEPGDTLFNIAVRLGTTVQDILDANDISNPNSLSVGQELVIPPPEIAGEEP